MALEGVMALLRPSPQISGGGAYYLQEVWTVWTSISALEERPRDASCLSVSKVK